MSQHRSVLRVPRSQTLLQVQNPVHHLGVIEGQEEKGRGDAVTRGWGDTAIRCATLAHPAKQLSPSPYRLRQYGIQYPFLEIRRVVLSSGRESLP